MNDVILNKVTTIERCVKRIHEVFEGNLWDRGTGTMSRPTAPLKVQSYGYLSRIAIV